MLQPFFLQGRQREGEAGKLYSPTDREMDLREGSAEAWCRGKKGSPRKTAETEREEKPREAPLQLNRRRIPVSTACMLQSGCYKGVPH